jgi:hypothetical protein
MTRETGHPGLESVGALERVEEARRFALVNTMRDRSARTWSALSRVARR